MEDRKGWRSRGAVEITLIVRVVLSRQGGRKVSLWEEVLAWVV